MAGPRLTGAADLQETLRRLGREAARRVTRRMVYAGLRRLSEAMREEAPGRIAREIGISARDGRTGRVVGKAGLGVGRGGARSGVGHLFVLGTRERVRERIGGRYRGLRNPTASQRSTGQSPPHAIIRRATRRARAEVIRTMRRRGREAIEQALLQARK